MTFAWLTPQRPVVLDWAQEGKLCRSNMGMLQLLMASVMTRTPMMLSMNPARAMSVTLRPPNEKAMALGGVATGSMKARELARVQGSMT